MIEATDVTVVIPAHDEEVRLPKLLRDLARQTRPPAAVVVVDSMSADSTADVVAALPPQPFPVRLIRGPLGAGAARNAGARTVTGPWILFLDADVRLAADFLTSLLGAVRPGDSAIYTARFTAYEPSLRRSTEALHRYFRLFANTSSPALVGHCVLVETDLHRFLDGFDTARELGEDHDYARNARRAGAVTRWVDDAVVMVSVRRFQRRSRWSSFLRYTTSELGRLCRTWIVDRTALGEPRSWDPR